MLGIIVCCITEYKEKCVRLAQMWPVQRAFKYLVSNLYFIW